MAPHAEETNPASTAYGRNALERLKHEEAVDSESVQALTSHHDLVLKTFRILIADLCQQFKGGHPG